MAKGTIKQRIALEGGDEIKKELLEIGRAGEVVWAKLNAQSKKLQPPTAFNKGIETLQRNFRDLAKFGDTLGTSFSKISKSWDDLGNAASRMVTRVGLISTAVTGAVTGLALLAKTSADSADALLENAERAGMSAKAFQTLSAVASLSGVGPEALARGLLNLNKQLADVTTGANKFATQGLQPVKDAAARIKEGFDGIGVNVIRFGQDLKKTEGTINDTTQALKELGITNVEAFKALSNEEKLIAIADGLEKIGDEAKRTVVGSQLMGKSFLQLLPFLSQGGAAIRKLIADLRALGLELDETQLRNLAGASDEFAKLGIAATLLRNRIVAAFAPDLIKGTSALLDFIAKNRQAIDEFVSWLATEAGKAVRDFFNILTGKDVPLETTWVKAWIMNIMAFASAVQGAVTNILIPMFNTLMSALTQVSKVLNDVFGLNVTAEQLGIVLLVAQFTAALALIPPIIATVSAVISTFYALMLAGPWGPVALAIAGMAALIIGHWDEIKVAGVAIWAVIKEAALAFWNDITQAATVFGAFFKGLWDGLFSELQALWTDAISFITGSVSSITSAIQGIIDLIMSAIEAARALASTPTADPSLPDVSEGGFARGGYVRGRGTSTSDSILARLSDGEFVIAAKAVRRYGPNLLRAINSMRLNPKKLPGFAAGGLVSVPTVKLGMPSFAMGGLVDALTHGFGVPGAPRLAAASAGPAMRPVNLSIDGQTVVMQASPEAGYQLERIAARRRLSSGGQKPFWYSG